MANGYKMKYGITIKGNLERITRKVCVTNHSEYVPYDDTTYIEAESDRGSMRDIFNLYLRLDNSISLNYKRTRIPQITVEKL